jgi:hypothetical protein
MTIETKPGHPAEAVDVTPMIGTWTNTNTASRQIAGLRIDVDNGQPMLNVWGVAHPSRLDWGTVPIGQLYRGSPETRPAAAFRAEFEIGPITALLEVNLSKGLLIVACMKTFHDGSGRSSYLVREFFRKESDSAIPATVPVDRRQWPVTCDEDGAVTAPLRLPPMDPGLFAGRWENTDATTRGIQEVRMIDSADERSLELRFADDPAGGPPWASNVTLFADQTAGAQATQFRAAITRNNQLMQMHGWVKLGVMVIAIFRSAADPAISASAPWFDREFFSKVDRG